MLSKKILKKIKKLEDDGLRIVVADSNGKLAYSSQNLGNRMLSERVLKKISKLEDAGLRIVATDDKGRIAYFSPVLGGSEKCKTEKWSALRLLPYSEMDDWY